MIDRYFSVHAEVRLHHLDCLLKEGKLDQLQIFHFIELTFKYSLRLGREYLKMDMDLT